MRPKSLLDIMDRMARRHDVLKKQQADRYPGRSLPDSLEMFISIDFVLAHLNKQLLDAVAYNTQLALTRGAGDPLTAVAADAVDSAASAVATRLIELRADDALRAKVAKMLRATRRESEKESRRTREKMAAFHTQQDGETAKKKKAEDSFAATMFLYNMLWNALQATQRALSLANTFSSAAMPARVS